MAWHGMTGHDMATLLKTFDNHKTIDMISIFQWLKKHHKYMKRYEEWWSIMKCCEVERRFSMVFWYFSRIHVGCPAHPCPSKPGQQTLKLHKIAYYCRHVTECKCQVSPKQGMHMQPYDTIGIWWHMYHNVSYFWNLPTCPNDQKTSHITTQKS